jgi:hypothetical protein
MSEKGTESAFFADSSVAKNRLPALLAPVADWEDNGMAPVAKEWTGLEWPCRQAHAVIEGVPKHNAAPAAE